MSDDELELAKKLTEGPIPVSLLLHIQDSARTVDHGRIEIILSGKGAPMDVVTTKRKRFE